MSDYYCAEYDDHGGIRLNCGKGLLVALDSDTRHMVQRWHDAAKPTQRFRAQYESVLALLDGRRCPHREWDGVPGSEEDLTRPRVEPKSWKLPSDARAAFDELRRYEDEIGLSYE
ncbi:MAG: hypothetical protein EOP28_02405 [Rhodococcus sp. (in: high G+C Gram-positive bacteria)]|nr:MAG: hypothetical protein EOP28_02405 [Rhodococcus sp. (in: high G+C Gram-positive bacteria)]